MRAPALVLRRRLTIAARACAPTQLAVASSKGPPRRARKKKAGASTTKYTMGPRAPDIEPMGAAFFGFTCQNRAVRAQFTAAPREDHFPEPVW